ncbi:MAG: hypothetical protein H7Y02_05005, partial [Candidatus Obscuribacterales bacterium]|nr:hypothetical protein [Steroidobacteraceae bacterium]
LHQSGYTEQARALFDEVLTRETLAKPSGAEFDNTLYRASALLAEGRAKQALTILEPFADSWRDFGKRFVPNGVKWLIVQARAQAQLGQLDAARRSLARVLELPTFNGSPPGDWDEHWAALIDVAVQAGDLASAQMAVAERGKTQLPASLDLSYLKFTAAHSGLKLRMNEGDAALALADGALTHLQTHTKDRDFPYLRAELLRARGAAHWQLRQRDAAQRDLQAALALLQRYQVADSPALLATRELLAQARRAR